MNEPDVKRLRELEKENSRLKRLLAHHDTEPAHEMPYFVEREAR